MMRNLEYMLAAFSLVASVSGFIGCGDKNNSRNPISPTIQVENSIGPSLHLSWPNGGETLETGLSYDARWSSKNVPEDISIDIKLVSPNGAKLDLATSLNDGIERFTVLKDSTGIYKIEVGTGIDTKIVSDQSDDTVTIVAPKTTLTPPPIPTPAPVDILVGAVGDIGWDAGDGRPSMARETGKLLDNVKWFLGLGDFAYPSGTLEQFRRYYDPFFGRYLNITFPAPGNHDYGSPGAAGYFEYFGSRARGNYYSFDLGAWHIISLDSNLSSSQMQSQVEWLRNDLEQNKKACAVALFHHPLYSSGQNGENPHMRAVWQALFENNAEFILSGHDHLYERFAPQDANRRFDPVRGIRQFTVGTGGATLYEFKDMKPNSEVRENKTHGILKLNLRQNSYGWEFVPIAGQSFRDFGTGECH